MADFFHFVPGYENYVFRAGREPLFFLLLAFLLTFLAVRTYTRLGRARAWRSGSVRGIHLHHSVPGIIASLAAGTAIIAFQPGDDSMLLLSALFGVGGALTLDQFGTAEMKKIARFLARSLRERTSTFVHCPPGLSLLLT